MGLRCSLLGHEYDEATVERDREERGNEVVITEREVQECERCGSEKVISENTEVRSLEPEPEPEPEPTSEPDSTPEPTPEPDSMPEPAPETGSSSVGSFADEAESGGADGFEPPASPETDDAVILDEDDEEEEPAESRQPGEWPETDDHRPAAGAESSEAEAASEPDSDTSEPTPEPASEPTPDTSDEGEVLDADAEAGRDTAAEEAATAWPDHDGDDQGYTAEPDDSDFQFGSESISSDDIEAATDESGAESAETVESAEPAENTEFVESASGITSAGPFEESDSDTIETVLVCPECGLEREAAGSSLRAGDICPECKRGYLAER